MVASFFGYLDFAKNLLLDINNVNSINVKSKEGNTAFIIACIHGHLEIVKLLIKYNININESNYRGNTGLIFAAFFGHYNIVEYLLENNVEINQINYNGENALIAACNNKQYNIIKLLIFAKIDINHTDNEGNNALLCSCKFENNLQIIKLLVMYGSDFNKINNHKQYPLIIACIYGNLEIIKYLLSINVNIDNNLLVILKNSNYQYKYYHIIEYFNHYVDYICSKRLLLLKNKNLN
jgi:hypothetical protein